VILTWDEGTTNTSRNQIPTVFYGAETSGPVPQTKADQPLTKRAVHLEESYGLPKLGDANRAPAIPDIWGA